MQTLIQEREVSFSLLNKAETLHNTWNKIQGKSLDYLYSIHNIILQRNAALELPSALQNQQVDQAQLIFKQTESIEKTIGLLGSTIPLFEKVSMDWLQLETEASRHLAKHLSRVPITSLPISTHSLIQVTSVTPSQVHDTIAQFAYMYKEEYILKLLAFTTISHRISSPDLFQSLIDNWTLESNIDDTLISITLERIKLYKQTKRILESND